jgi:hypothetical protein
LRLDGERESLLVNLMPEEPLNKAANNHPGEKYPEPERTGSKGAETKTRVVKTVIAASFGGLLLNAGFANHTWLSLPVLLLSYLCFGFALYIQLLNYNRMKKHAWRWSVLLVFVGSLVSLPHWSGSLKARPTAMAPPLPTNLATSAEMAALTKKIEEVRKTLAKVNQTNSIPLAKKYPLGYALFTLGPSAEIVTAAFLPSGVKID